MTETNKFKLKKNQCMMYKMMWMSIDIWQQDNPVCSPSAPETSQARTFLFVFTALFSFSFFTEII